MNAGSQDCGPVAAVGGGVADACEITRLLLVASQVATDGTSRLVGRGRLRCGAGRARPSGAYLLPGRHSAHLRLGQRLQPVRRRFC